LEPLVNNLGKTLQVFEDAINEFMDIMSEIVDEQ